MVICLEQTLALREDCLCTNKLTWDSDRAVCQVCAAEYHSVRFGKKFEVAGFYPGPAHIEAGYFVACQNYVHDVFDQLYGWQQVQAAVAQARKYYFTQLEGKSVE